MNTVDPLLSANSGPAKGAALVLFSGGQDSATCLAWALENFQRVETVGFDYSQRHAVEMQCRKDVLAAFRQEFPEWSARLHDDHVLHIPVLAEISDTALTSEQAIRFSESGLPTTFVPGRNLLFLTLAAALGYRRGIFHLVGGMCETDFSGYPDCRQTTISAQELTLQQGIDPRFTVKTPLMHLSKESTWALADQLGGSKLINLIIEKTHTCYLGDRSLRHEWGYGCGDCPACILRQRGWEQFSQSRTELRLRRGN